MNCGNTDVHQGHTWRDSSGNLQVCLGVPPERWNG
jgi:hypothetical protein